jgi:hypothetical protein
MKRTKRKKLVLARETTQIVKDTSLEKVVGGNVTDTACTGCCHGCSNIYSGCADTGKTCYCS